MPPPEDRVDGLLTGRDLLEKELGRRARALLRRSNDGYRVVRIDWIIIADTQDTIYLYKEVKTSGFSVDELIYAEDDRTGRCVGRGDPKLVLEACEILRNRMILDDLAGV
ncbi:MAG: hypothetical protein AB7L09_01625 [Nitrospira sp.]